MRVVQTPKHKFATPFSLYLGPGKSNSKPFCESTLFDPMVSSRASPSGSLLSSKMAEINKALMNSATGSRLRALRVVLHRVNDGFDMTSTMAAAMSATKEECAEARSLVNVLIQQYSAEKQDEALLPISSFQRLLKTADPRAVSMAVFALSSIRVEAVVPLVRAAVESCSRHSSAWVRKAAAHSLFSLRVSSPSSAQPLDDIETISHLLADANPIVIESAIFLATTVDIDTLVRILHAPFRKLCHFLAGMNADAQATSLMVLATYGRTQFVKPAESAKSSDLDGDHSLLLRCSARLMHSQSTSVVLQACLLWLAVGPDGEALHLAATHLLWRLHGRSTEHDFMLAKNILSLVRQHPQAFSKCSLDFFACYPCDPLYLRRVKLDIVRCLASPDNVHKIVHELSLYTWDGNIDFACLAIKTLAVVGSHVENAANLCVQRIVDRWDETKNKPLQKECALALRQLIFLWNGNRLPILKRLALSLDHLDSSPDAQKEIIWQLRIHSDELQNIVPDVLRKMSARFASLHSSVKLQLLEFAMRLGLSLGKQCPELAKYIMELAEFDLDFDVRDRARLFGKAFLCDGADSATKALTSALREFFTQDSRLGGPSNRFGTREMDVPFRLSTLSHVVEHIAGTNYIALPDAVERSSDDIIRGTSYFAGEIAGNEGKKSSSPLARRSESVDEDWSSSDDDSAVLSSHPPRDSHDAMRETVEIESDSSSGLDDFEAFGS